MWESGLQWAAYDVIDLLGDARTQLWSPDPRAPVWLTSYTPDLSVVLTAPLSLTSFLSSASPSLSFPLSVCSRIRCAQRVKTRLCIWGEASHSSCTLCLLHRSLGPDPALLASFWALGSSPCCGPLTCPLVLPWLPPLSSPLTCRLSGRCAFFRGVVHKACVRSSPSVLGKPLVPLLMPIHSIQVCHTSCTCHSLLNPHLPSLFFF